LAKLGIRWSAHRPHAGRFLWLAADSAVNPNWYVRNENRAFRLVKLIATCGPLDNDDPQPASTVMMPDED
jgi:hypothetical protein